MDILVMMISGVGGGYGGAEGDAVWAKEHVSDGMLGERRFKAVQGFRRSKFLSRSCSVLRKHSEGIA